jgi:heterodisulfide reductase subunit A2
MIASQALQFDTLVLGGGIAGLQVALDLADQDFKVAVVDRDASIGGNMIRLSKVFPTLDCSSCITTPKMAAAAHHENITLFTCCELDHAENEDGRIIASVTQNPRYVDVNKCTGCRECEYACPSFVEDHEQGGFSARKAIYVPFSNAIPQRAVLDTENCFMCGSSEVAGQCEEACPTGAIDFFQQPVALTIEANAMVVATGYKLLHDFPDKAYGANGRLPNVITSLQMERLLAPHGPYQRMLRPSDGKEPESVAFIQCAGSRDLSLGVPYCSRVCCMYAVKQAMLVSGALPLADITVYYMDIRAFGKNFEQFYQNAKAMGVEFVKAKPVIVGEGPDGGVLLRHEDQEGGSGGITREHDLVSMSLAMVPAWAPGENCAVSTAEDGFIKSVDPKLAPYLTDMEGVFAAGVAAGPKDIVDTIVEAGAAAMEVANHLHRMKARSRVAA